MHTHTYTHTYYTHKHTHVHTLTHTNRQLTVPPTIDDRGYLVMLPFNITSGSQVVFCPQLGGVYKLVSLLGTSKVCVCVFGACCAANLLCCKHMPHI